MSNTTIAGKPSTTIGDKDSQLVLRGSSVKIQWGNKFIDLIKNGKINCESQNILQTETSSDNIKEDGIYLVGEEIWINISGNKTLLSNSNDSLYVSFLSKQDKITSDQKQQALRNIGFYYNSLEDVKNAKISTGVVYVQSENKLYVISQDSIVEYNQFINQYNSSENIEGALKKLYIENNSLKIEDEQYVILENDNVIFNKSVQIDQELYSKNYSSNNGYKLYVQNGQSYLEVDNVVERSNRVEKLIDSFLPIGTIIMFDITNKTVPDLWKVCDGKDDTPNLTSMFIKKPETESNPESGTESGAESSPQTVEEPPVDSTPPTESTTSAEPIPPTELTDLSLYQIIYIIKVKNLSN